MKSSRKKTKPITHRTPPETSPAAELIVNSVDLLTAILLRLPAKSLIRFKSVSKHWLSLLSDSRFASTHSRLNPKPLVSSLYFYYNGKLDSISLDGSPAFPTLSFLHRRLTGQFTILHSCNGLLLIENPQITDDCVEARYIVCNPTTQKYSVLSQPGGGYYASGCLALDPSKSPHYKVVFVSSPTLTPSLEMDIFSSETAYWKKIFLVDRCNGDGAFWKGNLYWLYGRYSLWRFHVETDKVIEIPYAESGSRILSPYKTRYFGECGRGGRLFLIQSYSHSAAGFKIREMGCCCWNVKFRVNLRALISAFPEIESRNDKITVMCVVEGEKEDDLALILAIPGKVISYNLQKKTWNVLRNLASGQVNSRTMGMMGVLVFSRLLKACLLFEKCPGYWSTSSFFLFNF